MYLASPFTLPLPLPLPLPIPDPLQLSHLPGEYDLEQDAADSEGFPPLPLPAALDVIPHYEEGGGELAGEDGLAAVPLNRSNRLMLAKCPRQQQ